MILSFIVIDDSELDCFIARKIIGHVTDGKLPIKIFQSGTEALKMIKVDAIKPDDNDFILVLLDLQMPLMNGFQFVEEFEKLPKETRKKYKIVMLSSTRNNNDIFRVLTYNTVNHIIEKPLTREKLAAMIVQIEST